MDNVVEVRELTKQYDAFIALDKVSLAIPKGHIFGLLGPNGAGKTTLLRIINQILYPTSGDIRFNGEPLNANHVQNIGYMPEERGLYKSMKVGEQVLYLAQLKGLSKSEAKNKLQYWFQKFGIEDWLDKKIEELSKGMAQKVQFIVTVIHKPEFLIFDEPFSGFDPINADLIKDEILKLRDKGATILFSTHRMESVEELCDDIALINHGKKILEGDIATVKKTFRTNVFEIGLVTTNSLKAEESLNSAYKTTPDHFKSIDNMLKKRVYLQEGESPNELLKTLLTYGEVAYFKEVIPSINDIFIKMVTTNA